MRQELRIGLHSTDKTRARRRMAFSRRIEHGDRASGLLCAVIAAANGGCGDDSGARGIKHPGLNLYQWCPHQPCVRAGRKTAAGRVRSRPATKESPMQRPMTRPVILALAAL